MIAVIDTNVVISGLLNHDSVPGQIVRAALDGRFWIALSPHLRAELERAVAYDRIRLRLRSRWSDHDLRLFIDRFYMIAVEQEDAEPGREWIADDPDDNWVIQCAVSAGADYIVSGDNHLLSLASLGTMQVVSPAQFAKAINLFE